MKNLIINSPTKYQIVYRDRKNKKTSRKIVVIDQTVDKIISYCYLAHGIRTFKKKRIAAITSV